jgi:hypothetical protein
LKREFPQVVSWKSTQSSWNSIATYTVLVSKFVDILKNTKYFFAMLFP